MSDELANQVRQAFEPWREQYRKTAYRPVVDASATSEMSHFGGEPSMAADTVWPTCKECGKPLQFFLQLDLTQLPEGVDKPASEGLLQFFCCTSDPGMCSDWDPTSGANSVRIIEADGVSSDALARPDGAPDPFALGPIVGWKGVDDLPHPEDHEACGLTADYDFSVRPHRLSLEWKTGDVRFENLEEIEVEEVVSVALPGDKIGGWPHWVQGAEYPSCPKCQQQMTYLFQVDSEQNVPWMWGDVGVGHVTFCPQHPDVLAFGWACS